MTRASRRLLATHTWLVYAFLYAPIVVLVVFSFNRARRGSRWTGFTTDWYARLLNDRDLRAAAANSLLVAAVATFVSTVVGTMAALGLARYHFRSRLGSRATGVTRALLYLPVIVPEIVLGVSLLTLFGLLGVRLGIETVILAHVVFCLSYVAVVVKARLAGLDPSLEEAAMDLGAGPVATFVRVTLPQIAPGMIAGALLAFTISLDDYVVTSLVTGPQSTTVPVLVYSRLKTEVTPEVNAACTVLLAFTVVLIVAAQWLMRPRAEQPSETHP
jgi:spermidine/putrescine transport system permease protein